MKVRITTFKLTYKIIVTFLSCIFMIRPYYVQLNNTINTVWAFSAIIMATVSTIIIIKNRVCRNVWWWIIAFCGVRLFSSIFNCSSSLSSNISVSAQIVLAFNVGLLLDIKKSNSIGTVVNSVISCFLYLDVLSGILGISTYLGLPKEFSFMGYDNYVIYIILPLLCVKWAINYKKYNKVTKECWLCWVVCLAFKVTTRSYNAIMILIMYALIYLLMVNAKQLRRFITPRKAVILSLLLLAGITQLNIHDYFADFFLHLGKSTTLNSRTIIWDGVIPAIMDKLFLGHGDVGGNGEFQIMIGLNEFWIEATHAHNLYLQLLFDTGILGFIIYFIMVSRCLKYIGLARSNKLYMILTDGIVAFFFMCILDGYVGTTAIYMLYSIFYSYSVSDYREICNSSI